MRRAKIDRRTTETQIQLALTLEGRGRYDVRTGVRFLDHMLELFTRHGGFDLTLKATGDLDVDAHHTVEDVGIALGEAVAQAVGNKREAISLPDAAIVLMEGKPTVFVFEQGAYEMRLVEPGERIGGRTVLKSGLIAGDQVVIAGTYALKARKLKSQLGHGH